MGKYSYVILDRDCAFDVNSLNELLTQGKAILNEAIEISEKIEASITRISEIYSGIKREYQTIPLSVSIANIPKRIKKDLYQETIDRMDIVLNKLMDEIPSCDSGLAKDMGSVQEVLQDVKRRMRWGMRRSIVMMSATG